MAKLKVPTCTTLILEALRARDDFMDRAMLEAATGCSANQTSAALHELRYYRAVDVIVSPEGRGWWYARPPEEDTRQRVVNEIVDGIKKPNRRSRKPKILP